jgi:hypothetical protein
VRQAMKRRKLLYGKGDASRGLWRDTAVHLVSFGFTQELEVDQCLFVHKERQLDFGLYVDDIDDEQLRRLQDRFEERYEIKWLGFNSKNDSESSEKSKTFFGIRIRTEIDHVNKIVTQDQTQLIRKAAVRFGWVGTSIESVFRRQCTVHKNRFRRWKRVKQKKLNFTSVSSDQRQGGQCRRVRPDVLEHAVKGQLLAISTIRYQNVKIMWTKFCNFFVFKSS